MRKIPLGIVVTTLFFCAGQAWAQDPNPLQLFNNYFVTGDYVVGGVGLRGLGVNGLATGNITIPDPNQPNSAMVPKGADIVAAFLYWETVESSMSTFAGQQGFFNGYAITGTVLGNPNAPTSWSSGGCSGSSQGSKTMRTYRADVRPFLPLDSNPKSPTFGQVSANGSFSVSLADSGSNGGGAPLTLGATLVMIYRVLSPRVPLNAVILYDGAFAPSNTSQTMSEPIVGFYQASTSPVAKITHIVGNGKSNKSESVFLNGVNLPSLYGTLPPFPGIYNGSWDNPTWPVNAAVNANDASALTSVVPSSMNSGCVSWGAVIFSSTVQDTDGDGLLDVWEDNQGYTDVNTGQWVALPGANKNVKDIFVEVDYLNNLDGSAGAYLHSHLPKKDALDMVGKAFKAQGINVHFDVGNVYQGDPYVVTYPVALPNPLPPGTTAPPAGTGGNSISEGLFVCTDGATLCAFPGQPVFSWKGDFLFARNSNATVPNSMPPVPLLGNFQPGRKDSYHYVLFGHALGEPRSFWGTAANGLSNPNTSLPQLVSIVDSGTTATVTIQSPPGVLKPGDAVNPGDPAFGDANLDRVIVTGAVGQAALNGAYHFSTPSSSVGGNGVTTTVFTITTAGVKDGTYNFSDEPQLGVSYAGPTSTSGHSDFGGGADFAVTFGLWGADDAPGCQPDPSAPLAAGQAYCVNEVGTTLEEAGTLMHELGHTLTLTHGGMYFNDPQNPSVPTFELNCKSNVLTVMSYLFQVRGFPDGGIDFSSQTFSPLDETNLNESTGIGLDSQGKPALHFTRWYAPPNALDMQLQNTVGGRFATRHCDGTPITNGAQMVRVEGTTFSSPIDWNNNFIVPDATEPVAWQDVNFNGSTAGSPDAPFKGFNEWQNVDLRQMGARASAFGFSGGGGIGDFGGGGIGDFGGGGIGDFGGGGISDFGGGGIGDFGGGGIGDFGGGGAEQDTNTANSTADAATGLTVAMSGHFVVLKWTAPAFGQVRKYTIWRATGSFPTPALVVANSALFTNIGTVSGTPPSPTFTDMSVKNNVTYTYFVTDTNKQGVQSGASAPRTILVSF
ncbi:MAG TPA: hypothetical protein VGS20_12755 [Candidatus Acidoferrales bacterium]|nr:hypothetical protein [Candidatus Acidoferrales bacterium]